MNRRPKPSHGRAMIFVAGLTCIALLAPPAGAASRTAIAPSATIGQKAGAFELPDPRQLKGLITSWRARHDVPGAVIGMRVGDGEPLILVDGEDVASGGPYPAEGPFELASITKTFTGALALDLIDAGKLGLDDPIRKYVKQFPNGDRITIRHLLTHTSGLYPQWAEVGDTPFSQEMVELVASDLEHSFTPEEVIELVKDRPLQFPPGHGVGYSNVNTILLGEAIEGVTGTDITTAYHERLLVPFGLQDTYFRATEPGPAPVAGLYRFGGPIESTAYLPDRAIQSFVGAGAGMVSTPDDLLDWGVAFLREGARDHVDLSQSRFQVAPNGTALGVIPWSIDSGACIFGGECSNFDAVTGIGQLLGTSSMVAYFPRWDLTVVAFKNTGFGMPPEVEDLVAQMMRSMVGGN
jgi:D-alanyl-D-alanine carboxypeptidase